MELLSAWLTLCEENLLHWCITKTENLTFPDPTPWDHLFLHRANAIGQLNVKIVICPHKINLFYQFQKMTTYFINREQLLEALAGFKESISTRVSCNKCSSSEFVGILDTNQLTRNLFSNDIMPASFNWYPAKLSDDKDLKKFLVNHVFFTSKSEDNDVVSGIGYLGYNPCSVGVWVSAHIWCREMNSFKSLLVEMFRHGTIVTQPGTTLMWHTNYSGVEDEDVRAFLRTQLGSFYVSKVAVNQGGSYIETPIVGNTSGITSKLWAISCAVWFSHYRWK